MTRSRRRLRLSLGPRQVESLILAFSYAIDTFASDDEGEIAVESNRAVREWARVRDAIRREIGRQNVDIWNR